MISGAATRFDFGRLLAAIGAALVLVFGTVGCAGPAQYSPTGPLPVEVLGVVILPSTHPATGG
ncbi:MAG: hypothetical protein ACNA8P_11275, partial [Phycisphaerales bacterium]